MKTYRLFELFLTLTALYGLLNFEGGMRTLVPALCLSTVFLFEVLQEKRLKNERERSLYYRVLLCL